MSRMIVGLREANPEAGGSSSHLLANSGKRLIGVLLHGQEWATQLQILLRSPSAADQRSPSADHDRRLLVAKVLSSFTEALSILGSSESPGDELRQDSLCSDLDSGDSRRSWSPLSKDRRDSHKRRKVSESRLVVSPMTEDGHAWRKYGQKAILNAKHHRSYFRCTHKYDQGCGATKHVQRMDGGDSALYKITYIGVHTCALAPPIITTIDAGDALSNSYNICFSDSSNNNNPQDDSYRFHWPDVAAVADADDTAAKGENQVSKEETTSGLTDNLSSFDDETDLWSHLKDFGSLPPETTSVRHPEVDDCDYGNAAAMSNRYNFCTTDADSLIFTQDFDFDNNFHFK